MTAQLTVIHSTGPLMRVKLLHNSRGVLGLYNDMIILFSHNDDNDHYYSRGVGGEETARNGDFAA